MNDTNLIELVLQFNNTFNIPVLDRPQIPSKKRCKLRLNLLQEELNELKKAIKEENIIEIADSLADLQYVLIGTVLEFGLGDKFYDIINEVHRSNMTKVCEDEKTAIKTVEHYKEKGIDTFYKKINDKYVVYRKKDKKVLKSVKYSEPNLNNIINDV